MLISTQTDVTAKRFGLVKAVEMIAAAGFDAVDVSLFDNSSNEWVYEDGFEKTVTEAAKTAKNNNVIFNQAHAPFPSYRVCDDEYNKAIRPKLLRAIKVAGMLGVANIVIHPVFYATDKKENNIRMYNELLPYAKEANVKIAIENMWGRDKRRNIIVPNVCSVAEELADYADSLDSEWFTVCLDLGHIGLVGEYEGEFIRKLGNRRLTCLHVHDNDYLHDSHTVPFNGQLPWGEICQALADIDYKGDITLEADNFIVTQPPELIQSGLRFMYESASMLKKMIENGKEAKL